jgi:hypothetical protein
MMVHANVPHKIKYKLFCEAYKALCSIDLLLQNVETWQMQDLFSGVEQIQLLKIMFEHGEKLVL